MVFIIEKKPIFIFFPPQVPDLIFEELSRGATHFSGVISFFHFSVMGGIKV